MKKSRLIVALALTTFVISGAIFWTPINNIVANINFSSDSNEPDMPSVFKDVKREMGREEYQLRRAEGVALKRGVINDQPFDTSLRPAAIDKMEKQELALSQKAAQDTNLIAPAWSAIGPAPIPNGQTSPTQPVSGRATAIAIHPTNPSIVYVGTAQGGVYRTTNGGTNWTPIFDSALSLAVGAIAIAPSQPETVYVGTGEPNFSLDSYFGVGVYRIDNASTTATLTGPLNQDAVSNDVFSGRSIGEVLVHPTDPDTIFVASTSGLGGIRPANSSFPTRGIYRSTNATGATPTFTRLTSPFGNQNLSVRDMALDPNDPNNLVANIVANGGGVITTTNALAATPTFTPTLTFTGGTSSVTGEFAVVASVGAGNPTFYVATGFGGGRVYRSTDSGATWSQQIDNNFCGGQCFYDIAIAVDPTNANNVYLGGDPTITSAKSTNAAVSFTDNDAGVHVDTHALEVAPSDPTQVWLGTDGGIYKSTDSGVTYTQQNTTEFSATQFMSLDVHPTDENFTIGGTQDNGTNFFQPAGTWTRADFGDGGYAVIDQNAPDTTNVRMYHTYFNATTLQGYGTVASTASASDGMWSFRGCQVGGTTVNGITCNGAINFYAPLERGPGNPNSIYYGSDRLYRSADNGTNHTVVSQNPIEAGVPISSIGISPGNDNVRIVGLNSGGVYGTSTGSAVLANLDPANTIPTAAIARTIINPGSSTTAYVTLSAFGVANVWRTTNLSSGPPTWTNLTGTGANVLPQVPVNAIAVDPTENDIIYVGTDIGVYYTPDGGSNWYPYGTGLPRVAVFDISIVNATTALLGATPKRVRIATHGRGLYQADAALGPTAANASIGGRVLTSRGRSLNRVSITLTDSNGQKRVVTSNSFGYYKFNNLQVGETYTITAQHKKYDFTPRVVNLEDDLTGFDITSTQ